MSSEVTIPVPEQLDVGDKGNEKPEVLEDTWYVYESTVCWKIQGQQTSKTFSSPAQSETEIYSLMQLK